VKEETPKDKRRINGGIVQNEGVGEENMTVRKHKTSLLKQE
jgi:hypothetical protein